MNGAAPHSTDEGRGAPAIESSLLLPREHFEATLFIPGATRSRAVERPKGQHGFWTLALILLNKIGFVLQHSCR